MTLAFFITAVAVASLLEWQRRRQKLELDALCERLGLEHPPPRARITRLEAVLTAYLGALGLVFGALGAWAALDSSGVLRGGPPAAAGLIDGPYQLLVVLVGGGAALLLLGSRAWWRLRKALPPTPSR